MKKAILLLFLFVIGFAQAEAQMTTDNSYLRENYAKSKTAKKAAEKKAQRKALKAQRSKQKQADQKKPVVPKTSNEAYLAGAVPLTPEGVVCFERTFSAQGKSATELMDILKSFAEKKIQETQHLEISRILSETKDTLAASICEPMYFKRKKWESDSTLIQYQYLATAKPGEAKLRLWYISYCYEQSRLSGFNYKAEELITDQYALSKDRRSLSRSSGKFRKKTIDYFNALFEEIEAAIK